jgi:pimeloyl-ACP methyl ester carboxylesterase
MSRVGRCALLLSLAGIALAAGCSHEQAPTASAPEQPAVQAPPPPQAVAREATVRSLAEDASEIRYRVYGSGEPAIVFVHCWSCDSGYWDAQLNEFAQHYTVVTLDLAGHGRSSEEDRKDWSIANFGADVAAVVEAVGRPRVILVGSSMGGPVALEAARRLPGKVIGIVAVDTLRELAGPSPREQYEPLVEKLKADFAATTAEFVGRNFFTDTTDPILKQWIVDDMSAAPPKVAIPALLALFEMDYGAAVAELDLPILAINSTGYPTDEAAIRKVEPRFRLVPLEGVGHFPMLEAPATFNRVLARIVEAWAGLEAQRNPLPEAAAAG